MHNCCCYSKDFFCFVSYYDDILFSSIFSFTFISKCGSRSKSIVGIVYDLVAKIARVKFRCGNLITGACCIVLADVDSVPPFYSSSSSSFASPASSVPVSVSSSSSFTSMSPGSSASSPAEPFPVHSLVLVLVLLLSEFIVLGANTRRE